MRRLSSPEFALANLLTAAVSGPALAGALLAAAFLWASPSRAQIITAATINGSIKVVSSFSFLPARRLRRPAGRSSKQSGHRHG